MKSVVTSPLSTDSTTTVTQYVPNDAGSWVFSSSDTVTRTIVDSATFSVSKTSWPTSEINKHIDQYLEAKARSDIAVLKRYTKWQRKYIDYQATYAALLLGAISEEEFEKDAEQYAPNIKDLPVNEIVGEIRQLESLLDFELRSSELADYFETEPNIINQALEQVYSQLQLELNQDSDERRFNKIQAQNDE